MAELKPKGVRATHPDYDKMVERWKRCEDAAEGEHAIHKAGAKYLPKLAEETDADYQARLKRTPFFNAVWRTISGLKGMLFRKSPQRVVPASIEPFMADVDMAGTPLDLFAQDIAEELLTLGRIGILIDRPPMPLNADGTALTVAQAEALGLRPMMQSYDADEVINWKEERINNAMQLTLVVLCEDAAISGDQFGHETEERYRVLDLINGVYRQRVFRIDDKGNDEQVGEDIFPLMNNQPMNYIPFVFIGVDDVGSEVESTPLLDLVDMNLHHYQVSADYEHGCHFSGLPTLFISGYRPDETAPKIYIGGSSANCLPDPNAKAFYAETAGNFTALRENLNEKKAEMAVLGARMLEGQKAAVESAETLQQRSAGEQSQLAGMAQILGMAMTQCLRIFADWSGADGEVEYKLSTDFVPVGMTAQELTALVGAWQSGAISQQVLFDNLQRGELIAAGVTFDEEQARIGDASPPEPQMQDASNTVGAPDNMQAVADAMTAVVAQNQAALSQILKAITEPAPAPVMPESKPDTGMADMMQKMSDQHAEGMAAIADALGKEQLAPVINVAAPIVNMPEQPAPTINIAPAAVNISPPAITVNMPEQQPANVTVNNVDGKKTISIQRDAEGNIISGSVA